ncbi:hypothetical protein ACEQ8H_007839 [Pleosporales sp. CAS-2024a]
MQSFLIALFVLVALPGWCQADRFFQFINKCPYDIYYWTVGPPGSNMPHEDRDRVKVPAYGTNIYGMVNTVGWHGGVSLKIRDIPYYRVAPAGIMQVEYNLDPFGGSIWYDLSRINCIATSNYMDPMFCPLISGGIKLTLRGQPPKARCPHAHCNANGCHNVYDQHGSWLGEPTFACNLNADIVIETCVHGAGLQTFTGPP